MTVTPIDAKDEMLIVFKTAWDADPASTGLAVRYPDKSDVMPLGTETWVEVIIQHVGGGEANLAGSQTTRRYRSSGFLLFNIRTPFGEGLNEADNLSEVILRAYETARSSAVRYVSPKPNFVGQDGSWFLTSVVIEFQYDTIR